MAFAAATQRLDLAMIGMLMYINPTLQFLTAVYLFDEPMQTSRLVSFGLSGWGCCSTPAISGKNSAPAKQRRSPPALHIGRFHHPAPMASALSLNGNNKTI